MSGGAGYGAPMPAGESYGPPTGARDPEYGPPGGPGFSGLSGYEGAPRGVTPRWVVALFLFIAALPFAGCLGCTCGGVALGVSVGRHLKP